MTNDRAAQHDFDQWRADRRAAVTGPVGNLALVGYQSVWAEPEPVEEWPATVRREGVEAGVRITADAGSGVRLDGKPVDGEVFVGELQGDGTPLLTWGRQSIDVFSLDGSDYELRRYDAGSPAMSDFVEIETYPYDPAFVIEAELHRQDATDVPWTFTRESDSGHTKQVPGVLSLEVAGQPVELVAFLDHGVLVLTFADATTGEESHAPGRFLKLDMPGPDGRLVVDFNRAFIPPCGFSEFYSCPLPPRENRLTVPVRAGERHVRWSTPH